MTSTRPHLTPLGDRQLWALISSGTGSHPRHPLAGFDAALHLGEREHQGAGLASVNIKRGRGAGCPGLGTKGVTSVLGPGTLVCRMNRGADEFPVDVRGEQLDAVLRDEYASDDAIISCGLAVGVPWGMGTPDANPDKSGVIYHTGGIMSPGRCSSDLREMVTFGMEDVRDGEGKWGYYEEIATSYPDPDQPGLRRCAVALLVFLAPETVHWYEPVMTPVEFAP